MEQQGAAGTGGEDSSAPGRRDVAQGHRARLRAFLSGCTWERWITALIIINAITLGLETSKSAMASYGGLLMALDKVILGIFILEIAARIYAFGGRFWRDPWSLFDFSVIAIALVPATGNLSVLRALRIIRVLRLITTIKSMRRVVAGLINAIPGMGSVIALLLLLFYVFAVMATKLFGERFPEWFGTIGDSFYTLFQIMTLESWSMGIVRPVMEAYPYAWAFFVPFILMTSFTVLNLFIGIIVDGMQASSEEARKEEQAWEQREFDEILAEIRQLRTEVRALRSGQAGDGQEKA